MEAVGVSVGIVSLAGLFETVIHCFEYVHNGQQYEVQFQTSCVKLSNAHLRLTRWGEAINITEATLPDDAKAKQTRDRLEQIKRLFEQAKLTEEGFETQPQDATSDTDSGHGLREACSRMRRLSIDRFKYTTRQLKWIIRKERFNEMIDNVTDLVRDLEELFPASQDERKALAEKEAEELKAFAAELVPKLQEMAAKQEQRDGVLLKALEEKQGFRAEGLTVMNNNPRFGANNQGFQTGVYSGGANTTFNFGGK